MAAFVPIAYFAASVFTSAIAFRASPKDRLGILGLSVSLALLAYCRVTDITSWNELSSLLGFFGLLWITHIVKLVLLEKVKPPGDWRITYKNLFDFRGISTKEQNKKFTPQTPQTGKDVRASGEETRKNAGHRKSSQQRRIFLLKRLASVVTILLSNQIHTIAYSLLLQLSYDDFNPSKKTYIRRIHTVTLRETIIRSWLIFNFIWSSWAIFTAAHDVLAFAHVATGLDEPEDWPRLFGNPLEAYNVRRFWGRFWHSLVQRSYTAYGSVLSQGTLRLPPGSIADRICVNFTVFLISGIVHACITVQLGFRCGYREDLEFFLMCYAAMLVEEGVQHVVSRAFSKSWWSGWTGRGLGYIWVFGFLFWVLPKHQYPKVMCAPV